MTKSFLISDQHFRHKNILSFKRGDGSPLREFSSMEEMDETMIDNHNRVVGKNDKVYFLGDVAICNSSSFDDVMSRLNGNKVLIKGNHDGLKLHSYSKWFKDIRAYSVMDKFFLSHIPIHVDSLSRWKANIHGHTHYKNVGNDRYFCVCVEQPLINYTPIDFECIRELYKCQLG